MRTLAQTGVPASRRSLRALLVALGTGAALLGAGAVSANEGAPPLKELKVCQDPANMPFSNDKGEGLENRIAELFAGSLGVPVKYYSYPQRFAFVRNTLRYKLPGEDFRCDVMLGVPAGFDQVSGTKPYYRSTYALVFPKGKGLDGVKTGEDFLRLDPATLKALKIGLYDKSPGSKWLARHDLVDQGVPYATVDVVAEHYPGWMIDNDLVKGKIDVAILWGPVAAYYASKIKDMELVVVPLKSEPGIKFDFEIAMGVRYGEPEWKKQIETLIDRHKDDLDRILKAYHVPLVDEQLNPIVY